MVERTLSVYRGGKLHCCLLIFGCSLFSRSQQANRSASPVKRYRRWEPWQMFQIVAVWNICAFLMSMALLCSLSPDFHPSSASLSSPESLEKLHYDAIEQQGRLVRSSCGSLPPHPRRMAYMWGGLFFQGRLAFIFCEDGLPSHLHLF